MQRRPSGPAGESSPLRRARLARNLTLEDVVEDVDEALAKHPARCVAGCWSGCPGTVCCGITWSGCWELRDPAARPGPGPTWEHGLATWAPATCPAGIWAAARCLRRGRRKPGPGTWRRARSCHRRSGRPVATGTRGSGPAPSSPPLSCVSSRLDAGSAVSAITPCYAPVPRRKSSLHSSRCPSRCVTARAGSSGITSTMQPRQPHRTAHTWSRRRPRTTVSAST
jgi:hypothetical protein